MPARLEVVKDVTGQRVWFYPQEGRPTATPTVTIKDKNGTTVTAAATTNVTQVTVNTTVRLQNAVGDKDLTLNSVTGIEFRKSYLLTNDLGQQEWVRAFAVDALAGTVKLDEPLEFAHSPGSTFASTAFYRELQATEVDALAELYRARASYAVGGLTYTQEIPFDIVLTPLVSPLSVEFLKRRRPDLMGQEHAETLGTDFADLRGEAWDVVLKGVREHISSLDKWRPALIRTPEDLEEWALAELDLLLHENGVDVLRGDWDAQSAIEHLERRAAKRRGLALGAISWNDFDEDDSVSSDEEAPMVPDLVR